MDKSTPLSPINESILKYDQNDVDNLIPKGLESVMEKIQNPTKVSEKQTGGAVKKIKEYDFKKEWVLSRSHLFFHK